MVMLIATVLVQLLLVGVVLGVATAMLLEAVQARRPAIGRPRFRPTFASHAAPVRPATWRAHRKHAA